MTITRIQHSQRAAATRGMSLIEVLVSLVVLSVGVLAVVALQLISKRNNADAGQRTVAAQLAYNMIERIRTNPDINALPTYVAQAALGVGPGPTAQQSTPTTSCDTANCTPTQLAQYDVWLWEQNLIGASETFGTGTAAQKAGGLVSPIGCITGPAAGSNPVGSVSGLYTVTIAWRGSVQIPDNAAVPCGQDPQASGTNLYSKSGSDNTYRRTAQFTVYVTCRPLPGSTVC